MIIFGTRGVKSTIKEGNFICPQCATTRPYKHKKVTRFFTLYFIPVIPLGRIGDYVECQSCKGTFVERVLDYNPNQQNNEFQSVYEQAMRHSMVLIMLADGEIDESEMEMVQKIINKFGHNDMSMEELEAYVEEVQANSEPIDTYLKEVAPSLNEHGKEMIIKCALAVAAADGHVDPSELQLISEMAKAMEMSTSHLKGIINEIVEQKPSFSNN
ncbi:MAG: TerB family tellurite resistance protein [Lewinella sp.]|nr:TerB family tellurite resistance protein [Lewinella sp.]